MQTENLVAVNDFCQNHDIEISFISSLEQTGLIEFTTIREDMFIDAEQLPQLEKFVHLYYELDINMQGIETITHLLTRVIVMQDEIISLKNRLRLYESRW